MKKITEHFYEADEGCFIVRKEDDFIMGEAIDLGSSDFIDNYKDIPFTEESYKEFYLSIGMEVPTKEVETTEKEVKADQIVVE